MSLAPVVSLLERRIGLDSASLGPTAVPAAVADRMRTLGLADPSAYAARLAEQADEFDTLVDRLVVPETWFCRGTGLFDELARQAAAYSPKTPKLRPAPSPLRGGAAAPFRALSLPCSTGEEPYSLAIALLEAGLAPEWWTIDGVDLSPRLINAARRGVYRELSFRETDPGLRGRYFRPVADGWELDARVRALVRFHVGNLVDPGLLPGQSGAYNLILCRNLLIYLTPAARRQALTALERLLAPGGWLAVGHAEPRVLDGRPFRRVGPESYFLFRREPAPGPRPAPEVGPGRAPPPAETPTPVPEARDAGSASRTPPAPTGAVPEEEPLAQARRLADAGRLDEALAECQARLRQGRPSADLFGLLGVIQQARGESNAAADAFRKALYLDPDHGEALVHAMLLAVRRGDAGRAAALRDRLARINPGGEP
jgi:chemotaxis protein methyltransferase WspC